MPRCTHSWTAASPDDRQGGVDDIDRLIDAGFDDAGLTRMLADGFDCNYVPDANGLTAGGWLSHVRDVLDTALAVTDPPSPYPRRFRDAPEEGHEVQQAPWARASGAR